MDRERGDFVANQWGREDHVALPARHVSPGAHRGERCGHQTKMKFRKEGKKERSSRGAGIVLNERYSKALSGLENDEQRKTEDKQRMLGLAPWHLGHYPHLTKVSYQPS